MFHNYSGASAFPVTSVIWRAHSGLLRAPEHPYIYPSPGGLTLVLYEVSKSLPSQWWPWVSLGITKPHPDMASGGWGAIQMICWEK